ncbi:calmegin-like isoform X2 [Tachypleus tridentatus]|uniref:calmegin-like isoform X2 n=1 Tax=Tachypleus tridentatus TaxID=6853 RepID=UPI003FD392A6
MESVALQRRMKLSLMLLMVSVLVIHAVSTRAGDNEVRVEAEKNSASGTVIEKIPYTTPKPIGNVYIAEHFDDPKAFEKRWIISEAKKDDAEVVAKYNGKWVVEEAERNGLTGDLGLAMKSKAHHHAISSRLDKPFVFDGKPFILQYEVRFQNGQECGGAYLKLLSYVEGLDLKNFHDKTSYSIMFGPDKCGNEEKVHFIFRHKNPNNGTVEEKHWKKSTSISNLDVVFKDRKPHLFTLKITPDNQFEVLVDKKTIQKGSLLEDMDPPVNPLAEIDDPNDTKPEDWDEQEKIPDPNTEKPDDWDEDALRLIPDPTAIKPKGWLEDEPEFITDPDARKPSDWDNDVDGEWEAPFISNPKCIVGCGEWKPPMIDNPEYKGKWKPPMINNPNYKGKWEPRKIPNPHYFEDLEPYKMATIEALGFELWSITDNIMFDNIIITDDPVVAEQWAEDTWVLKKEIADRETDNLLVRLIKYSNKQPLLWIVYVLVIGIPVILFIGFCCTTSPTSKRKEEEQRARAKKTDEVLPDVKPKAHMRNPWTKVDSKEKTKKDEDHLSQKKKESSQEEEGERKEQEVEEAELGKAGEESVENIDGLGGGDVRLSPRRRITRRE